MKSLRTLVTAIVAGICLWAAVPAKADVVEPVYLTLGNGAVFSGTLTFSNNTFTDLVGVDATLTDYELGTKGYVGPPDVDDIDFVTDAGSTALIAGERVFKVADDDTVRGILKRNTITLQLDISNDPPTIIDDVRVPIFGKIYVSGVNLIANDVNPSGQQVDAPNGASITPEPGSWLLLATGLAGLGPLITRRGKQRLGL